MIRRLLKGAKGYEAASIFTLLLVLFETALEVILPMFMSYILNTLQLFANGEVMKDALTYLDWSNGQIVTIAANSFTLVTENILKNTVLTYGVLMIISAVLSLSAGAVAGRLCAVAGAGFSKNMRSYLFAKIQDFSFSNVDKFSTASLVTRSTTDVNNAQQSFMMLIRTVIRAPAMMIFSFVMAFIRHPDMAWVFLVAVPLLGVVMFALSTKVYPLFRYMLKKYDKMNADVQENLVAIRVVKAFVREDYEEEKYRNSTEEVRKAQLKAEKLLVLMNPLTNCIVYGTIATLLIIGGTDIANGKIESGTLTAMMSYCTQILISVMLICFIAVQMVMSRASIDRIYEVLETEPDIKDGPGTQTVADGSIKFDHVNFSYSNNKDNLTLEDINLDIASGETVGIVGGTGDGKSSLAQLIPRFYDVLSGSVIVGGEDVRNYSLFNLREGVSMVLQKNVLFSGTIRENLLWGNKDATQEQIEEACKAACAHDFIMSFPDGYETDLGQGGVNVSGGQKQRLCIARALLKKPKIMILDDSTSAVDTATDAQIRAGLKKLDKNMTTIIIAQRISSVEGCDKIVVLDDGKINAVGTHEQLLKTCKIYQEVYHSQQKGTVEGGEN
ncbi:aBC transporter permease/ATP-binding protein [Corallococcus sp. CAG:1435]|uniref:ABC transporter ATP-binding protein n=1 Tax=Candidatus Fimimonas gallinarum TaxID=2840821 RepID=A0A9D1E409_9BACT|nr:aBC transporter permease/ATP-binding protein [Corallococcus sp. CAG:1435]HIR66010.1 ABC transporter ATP-binding protein [Candidatus Fimimonas gallinarum]